MQLARVISYYDRYHTALDRLVEMADLDVLQIDYSWPPQRPGNAPYAPGLLRQLQTLHKTMYLDPHFHVITNAGGGDPAGCAEAVGQYLCEHGDAELPLTVIRGDNVLHSLEAFTAAGIVLTDRETGSPHHPPTQRLLAAQVELGAGPLATALGEGSRLVVAGGYDISAPWIAAAVAALRWSWDQTEELSQLAVAAHLPETVFHIDSQNSLTVKALPSGRSSTQQHLRNLLTSADDGLLRHADIDCQVSQLEWRPTDATSCLAGVTGQPPPGQWLLRLTYQAGYFAAALLECDAATGCGDSAAEVLRDLLDVEADRVRKITTDSLFRAGEDGPAFIRVRCESQRREPCLEFVDAVTNLVIQCKVPGCQLTESLPSCQLQTSQICCHVPRGAIAVSVDTRPAKEWR